LNESNERGVEFSKRKEQGVVMKRVLGIVVAVAVLAGVAAVYAGDAGCCAAGKAKSASAGCSSACSKMLSKLNLTPDQQSRIAVLNQQLRTATSKSERIAMFTQGMQRILTPEQFEQWKSSCDMAVKNGTCPLSTAPSCSGKAG
jgi:hypothetical protein